VTAADAERRRIERNLHDGAQQRLIAILMRLEAIADDPANRQGALGPICEELARALEELRDLAHGLFPPLLVSDGLEAALDAATRRAGLPVRLEARGIGRFGPEVEAAVYFCCVEALQNAAKHAGAGARATVTISRTPSTLEFSVEDDGAGFVPAHTRQRYGLANLRDRVEALGGTSEIVSAPDRGTVVRGAVPIG
jgi:signal transduction histidine kinase